MTSRRKKVKSPGKKVDNAPTSMGMSDSPRPKGKKKRRPKLGSDPTKKSSGASKYVPFRGALGAIERSATLLENRDVYKRSMAPLKAKLPPNFDTMPEDDQRIVVEDLRQMANHLPDYFGDYVGPALQIYLDTLDPDLAKIRAEIDRLQDQDPQPTPDALAETLSRLFKEAIAPTKGKEQEALVNQLRAMLDRLPRFYHDRLINQAHKALNPFDRQIGIAGATFLGPSKVAHSQITGASPEADEYQHISNRGIQQLVRIEGELYTPVYMSVVADSSTGKSHPKYKDFSQTKDGMVQIHTGGSGTEDATLWVSFGRPLRQVKWLEVYGYKQDADPLLRSFLVPVSIANLISAETATEHKTGGIAVDINVDKHYERNQLGIRSPRSMELLRQFALPGSLRTYYTGAEKLKPPPEWGDVRHINELKDHLGIPRETLKDRPIFTDPIEKDFISQKKYKTDADELSRMYAYFMDNPQLLPTDESGQLEVMPLGLARLVPLEVFYRQYRPELKKISQEEFFHQYVAPWATQAQIAKMVAEDYEDLTKTPEKILDKPPEIVYNADLGETRIGERRSAAMALSRRIQTLLNARFQFLSSADEAQNKITELFKDRSYKGSLSKPVLGRLQEQLKVLKSDYQFRIGDIDRVQKQLPIYREAIAAHLVELNKQKETDDRLKPIVAALEKTLLAQPLELASLDQGPHLSLPSPSSFSGLSSDVQPVTEQGRELQANVTAGGGDCFFHSLFEALNNRRSSVDSQQAIRDQIAEALRDNPRLATSHFGDGIQGQQALDDFIRTIRTPGTWIPDNGPAIVADALRLRIVIHRPDGSIYYDARPNETLVGIPQKTVHVQYTGAHYNSYTAAPL